jgi:intracellular septation protein
MKFLFDIFPVVLFFAAYVWTDDIYIATGVAMVATIVQVVYARLRYGKVETMLWISLGLILLLGALTLLLHDKRFIMWKPTVLYWVLAAALAVASTIFKKNLVKVFFLKARVELPPALWNRLNLVWIAFLLGMGILNLYVAYNFSEAFWVKFKLFGTTALTFLFFLAHFPVLAKYLDDKEPG